MKGKSAFVILLLAAAGVVAGYLGYNQIQSAKAEAVALRTWATEMAAWSKTTTAKQREIVKVLAENHAAQKQLIDAMNRRDQKLNEDLEILKNRLETLQLGTLSEADQKTKLEDKQKELDPKLDKHKQKVADAKQEVDQATDEVEAATGEDSEATQDAQEFQDEYSNEDSPVQTDLEKWASNPEALANPNNQEKVKTHAKDLKNKRDEIEKDIKDLDSRIAELRREIAELEALDPISQEDREKLEQKREELARLEKEKEAKEKQFDLLSALMCMLKVVTKVGAVVATLEGNPAAGAALNDVSDSIPCDAGSGKNGEGEYSQPPGGPPAQPTGSTPDPPPQPELTPTPDPEPTPDPKPSPPSGGGGDTGKTLDVADSVGPYLLKRNNLDVVYQNKDEGGEFKKLLTIEEVDKEKVDQGKVMSFSIDPPRLVVKHPKNADDVWLLEDGKPARKAPNAGTLPIE